MTAKTNPLKPTSRGSHQELLCPDEEYQPSHYDGVHVLNVWLTSADKRISEAIDKLCEDVKFEGQSKLIRNQLHVLFLNFIRLKQVKPKGSIRYSRRNKAWAEFNENFPNPWGVSSKIDTVIDTLEEEKLLHKETGFKTTIKIKGKPENIGKQTRIKPSAKFVKEYMTPYSLLEVPIEYHKSFPLVRIHIKIQSKYIKDNTQHYVEEAKGKTAISGFLKTTKEKLRSYNTFLSNVDIGLDNVPETEDIINEVDTTLSKRVYRVFNDKEITRGGRIYGGFWIQMRSAYRPFLLINNNRTVECDYSSQHANMLYGYCLGKPISEVLGEGKDPYQIESYPRALGKLFFTMALNTRRANLKKALENKFTKALRGNNQKDKEEAELLYPYVRDSFEDFLDSFESLHKEALKYLYPHTAKEKWWHRFQFFDSQIAMYVLEQTRLLGIPCLSVHDSFIVEEKHEEKLQRIMKEAYLKAEHIPNLSKCIPDIKTNKRDDP